MGQRTILLRDPWTDYNGTEHAAGVFLRVDDEVADELITDGTAKARTPEEAKAEEEGGDDIEEGAYGDEEKPKKKGKKKKGKGKKNK